MLHCNAAFFNYGNANNVLFILPDFTFIGCEIAVIFGIAENANNK